MNAVCLSGYITRVAVNGDNVLRFTMVAKHGYNAKKGQKMTEFIPCCLFKPSEKMRSLFTQEGIHLELRGRISSSKYEKDGEAKYSTQVIVDPQSISFLK
ncbi:single-stranded DNA-binding protein [Candidatus Woesearchaeota archaeon]|nr:single-stranded DNA-binding protein [Candidatus Woesearchaeota archaeon]